MEFPIDSIRVKKPKRLPTVLTKEEVRKVIGCMAGTHRLTAREIELSGNDVPPDEEAAALLSGLGRAQVAILPVNQLHNALAILRRAFEYYSETHDLDRAVAIAETPLPPTAGHQTGMSQLLGHGLELVPATSLAPGRIPSPAQSS